MGSDPTLEPVREKAGELVERVLEHQGGMGTSPHGIGCTYCMTKAIELKKLLKGE